MLVLGLDLSTQSLSAVLLAGQDGKQPQIIGRWCQPFADLIDLYQLRADSLTLAPAAELPADLQQGQYDQPPGMYLRSLDRLFKQMQADGCPLEQLAAINCSSQQHGQIYLNSNFDNACATLERLDPSARLDSALENHFAASYAYPRAPIWLTANSGAQAQYLREQLGEELLLQISGSAAPLRFSGLIIRWLMQHYNQSYHNSSRIHLISSWLAAVLAGRADAAIDWGSASGTLLMNYAQRCWSEQLLSTLAAGFDHAAGLRAKLPQLSSPLAIQGTVNSYLINKYAVNPNCVILAGSGDNPQSKVCAAGDLLSLGSSFVMMADPANDRHFHPWANALYDGLGRPFSFGCRSNGALIWDALRNSLGLSLADQEQLLQRYPAGSVKPRLWLKVSESFPPAPADQITPTFTQPQDLVALIDGTLEQMARASHTVFGHSKQTLYLTGGVSNSPALCRRISHYWQRPIANLATFDASYGAAVAAILAKCGQVTTF